jgi:diphthine-ammonia ligase
MSKTAVLWTGGKDSALAFYEAQRAGQDIEHLVTFASEGADFLAHPISFMQLQAEAAGLPHETITITEPFRQGYERAIGDLKEKKGIETLVTGDISLVDGRPNWIRECSRPSGMQVLTPLWEQDRLGILKRLLNHGFRVILSGGYQPWFTEDWLGRELNNDSLEELCRLGQEKGIDLCGEQGEYHTIVLDAPFFKKRIILDAFRRSRHESLWFMDGPTLHLGNKLY